MLANLAGGATCLLHLGGGTGETKDSDLSKWSLSLEMVAATVKFALETKRLAEEWNKKDAEERDLNVDRTNNEEEDSDIEEGDLSESPDKYSYTLATLPQLM